MHLTLMQMPARCQNRTQHTRVHELLCMYVRWLCTYACVLVCVLVLACSESVPLAKWQCAELMLTHAIQLVPIARIQYATHVFQVVVVVILVVAATEIFMSCISILVCPCPCTCCWLAGDTPDHIHITVRAIVFQIAFVAVHLISTFFYWGFK